MAVKARYGAEVSTLREARRQFLLHRSPWVLGAGIVAVLVLRVAVGDPTWRDAVAVAGMLAFYPLGEWAIHVYILHSVPSPARRAHWAHHKTPNDLWGVLLGPQEIAGLLLLAVPAAVAAWAGIISLIAGPVPFAPVVTAALTGYLLVLAYEWCHFLIHTAYRPRSRYYRSIWRTHRLHHFKNERYWHGVTNTLGDRLLGTFPDHRKIERSRTARALGPDAGPTAGPTVGV